MLIDNNLVKDELKNVALNDAALFLRSFGIHLSANQAEIFDSLLEKPDKYLAEYTKLVNVVLSSFRGEERVSVNINNNNYAAFFNEVSSLSKKLDANTHTLVKRDGEYSLEEAKP